MRLAGLREYFNEIVDSCAWEVIPTDRPYGTVDVMFQAELGIAYNEALHLTLPRQFVIQRGWPRRPRGWQRMKLSS